MNRRTLRFKLIAGGCLVVLLPLLAVGFIAEMKVSQTLEAEAGRQMLSLANANARMVEMTLSTELKAIEQIAASPILTEATIAARQGSSTGDYGNALGTVLKSIRQKRSDDYVSLLVIDKDGNFLSDSHEGALKGISLNHKDVLREVVMGKAIIGDAVKSEVSGNPVLYLMAPVTASGGEVLGVLAIQYSLTHLNRAITNTHGKTGYGFGLDRSGTTVLHPDIQRVLADNFYQLKEMEPIAAQIKARKAGIGKYLFAGTEKMAGFVPVEMGGWSIAITRNHEEIIAQASAIRNTIILESFISIILVIGTIFLLSRPLIKPLKRAAEVVSGVAGAVSSSSLQLSTSSQSLAEGVSEQAASLEETSSSLEEISSIAKQTADRSVRAGDLMRQAQSAAQKVIACLDGLTTSMQEVSIASEQTSRIVKNIDEIAFQTNLLALNAAVEAARAGEAGAGFAVVAEEVRNLALRAAESAQSTAGLIEDTLHKIRQGVELVQKTNDAFGDLGKYRVGVTDLIDQISVAAKEQAEGVEQVNRAVAEMDKVTQQTAATAEESASTASELSAQAEELIRASESLLDIVESNAAGETLRNV